MLVKRLPGSGLPPGSDPERTGLHETFLGPMTNPLNFRLQLLLFNSDLF